MFGKSVKPHLVNPRTVAPIRVRTASGIITLDRLYDFPTAIGTFKDGMLNPHLDTTLISEGACMEQDWCFNGSKKGKEVVVPEAETGTEQRF